MPEEPIESNPEQEAKERIDSELADLEARLEGFDQRIGAIRAGSTMPDPPGLNIQRPKMLQKETQEQIRKDQESYRGLGVGLSAAYSLLGLPIVGFGIGKLIEMNGGGSGPTGILVLVGFALGIWFTIYTVNRVGK